MRAPEKKVEVEKVLIPISSDSFTDLTVIGKLITDYTDEAPAAGGGKSDNTMLSRLYLHLADTLDAELGVAVVFDSDNEEDSDFEIKEDESDEEEGDEQVMIIHHDFVYCS